MKDFAIEGRTHVSGSAGAGSSQSAISGQTQLHAEETAQDAAVEYLPYRELAFAVFRQSFIDLGVQMDKMRAIGGQVVKGTGRGLAADDSDRNSARLFLFDPEWRQMRSHWLAWLGLTEDDLWTMLDKATHQGGVNRVIAALEGGRGRLLNGVRAPGQRRMVVSKVDDVYSGLEHDMVVFDEAGA